MPDGSESWVEAIAGLPVLAERLGCPPCIQLAELIEKHHPWVGPRERAAYLRAARSAANAVKACLVEARMQSALNDYFEGKASRGTTALAELEKLIPRFDRIPLWLHSEHGHNFILEVLATLKEI